VLKNQIGTQIEGEDMKFVPWWWKALLCLVIAITLVGGGWWYQSEKKRVEALISSQLEAISHLKVEAIKSWKFERKGDALVLSANPLIKDFLLSYQPDMSADEINKKFFRLVNYLNEIRESYRYEDVILTDTKGQVLISSKGTKGLDESALKALRKALELREPLITDVHEAEEAHHPHAGVVAGVFDGGTGKPIGALALKQDAKDFLYSLLEIMPIPRKTVESILVRKDGNEVLFLSELKGRADSALKLRVPLSEQGDIAVMAINGAEGFNTGRGYNGEEVLAFILPVPDSSWKLITQIESKEIFPFISRPSLQIFGILGLLILFFGAGFVAIKERYKKAHFRALNRVNERFGATLRSIGDAVIVTDENGIVEMLNPVAEQLTGWSDGEARGKKLEEIFHIVNEETRKEVENPVTRVLREGVVVGLANHTLLISKDGREIPIADSGAPIRTPDGSITGVVLVFRDQSAERKAQREIKEAKEFAESIVATLRESLVVLDDSLRIVSANRHFYRTFNVTPQETVGNPIFEIANRRWDNPQLRELLEDILPSNSHFEGFEVLYTDEFGDKRIFLLNGRRLYSEHGKTEKIY
jgi:PAS domain S-box-containing protein